MKTEALISGFFALALTSLFTVLLFLGKISEVTYGTLLVALALVCVVLLVLPRLRELDMKNLRLTLNEIKQVKADVEEVKGDIVQMYGGIERLKSQPFVLDKEKMRELGLKGDTLAMAGATMRYQAGCIRRERERLARIFAGEKDPEKIAEAILDNSLDEKVFKWSGPEAPLDAEPVSRKDRDKQKESEQEKT